MARTIKNGLVHVYTGDGKGKTTAALGLAVRASGAGVSVYIHQFIKNASYSEIRTLDKLDNIIIEQSGRGCFIKGKPANEDIELARRGLAKSVKVMQSGAHGLVILDEVNVAVQLGLLEEIDIISAISNKPASVELVLTGRGCPAGIMKRADLVTEMKKIRHPFDKGVRARKGIEY